MKLTAHDIAAHTSIRHPDYNGRFWIVGGPYDTDSQ